jgi:glucose-6-phosphate-specific signal transduction histidine kinase
MQDIKAWIFWLLSFDMYILLIPIIFVIVEFLKLSFFSKFGSDMKRKSFIFLSAWVLGIILCACWQIIFHNEFKISEYILNVFIVPLVAGGAADNIQHIKEAIEYIKTIRSNK